VDALKSHKKGLMQQLFPRDGETQPRLRFPEFQDAGDWEERLFAELYDFKPTNVFSRDQLNYTSGLVKNIHYGDIHTKFSTSFRIEAESVPFINLSASLSKIKSDTFCQESDMVFADASEDLADVGKSIELVDLNGEKVLSGSHTILARQRENIFSVGFAGHLFKGRGVRAQIEKEAQGTKVLQISPGRLAGIKVIFPRSKAEQQRIADCLSSLDDLITAATRQLATLKTHKQGLMQQMFPSMEEVES
jgi:type I restriction enzyme S subunit